MAKLTSSYRIKDGKIVRKPTKKSVSQRIAEKKNPKRRYRPAGRGT